MSPFLCRRIQLTAVPSILCTISLIHIAAYESRQNLSCFAVQQTKQKIAAVASEAVSFIMANFLFNIKFFAAILIWILSFGYPVAAFSFDKSCLFVTEEILYSIRMISDQGSQGVKGVPNFQAGVFISHASTDGLDCIGYRIEIVCLIGTLSPILQHFKHTMKEFK